MWLARRSHKVLGLLILLWLSLWVGPSKLQAGEDLSKLRPLKARGFFVSQSLSSSNLAHIQVEMNLQEGFFAYRERFRLKVLSPENIQVGELNINPIVEFQDSFSQKIKKGVKTSATLNTQLEIPPHIPSIKKFVLALTYIACTKKFCLTPRSLHFEVPVPQSLLASRVQSESLEKEALSPPLLSKDSIMGKLQENLPLALVLIFLMGLITSLTPCVYPLIPITMAVVGSHRERFLFQSFLVSLSYVMGIGFTYALLGVMAARTGALFGSLISHPVVTLSISLTFFLMGLSLLGLFEIKVPRFMENQKLSSKKGYGRAFLSGLLAGVIASPCVGPVLVGLLAYIAKTQNMALGFGLLFTFAMGFGSLFILLGTFSGLASKLPRSGPWMNGVKTILALLFFGLSMGYAWPLLKPHLPGKEHSQNQVAWQAFSPSLVEEAQKEGVPVIIDFYADWCVACVEMERFTFSNQKVADLTQKFKMLKVDATFPFKELSGWQKSYEVYGLPTMIFINSKGKVQKDLTLTGFEKAESFIKRMEQAL